MPFLSDKLYGPLKFVAQIALPAVGTLYFALAGIWNLPVPEKVLGTITAVDTFLGVLLGLSSTAYAKSTKNILPPQYSGALNVTETPDKLVYSLELNHPPEELKNQKEVLLKVNAPPSQ